YRQRRCLKLPKTRRFLHNGPWSSLNDAWSGPRPTPLVYSHHQFEGRLLFAALTSGARPVTPSIAISIWRSASSLSNSTTLWDITTALTYSGLKLTGPAGGPSTFSRPMIATPRPTTPPK